MGLHGAHKSLYNTSMKQFAILLLFSAFLFPLFAIAAPCPQGAVCIENPLKATTLLQLLNNIINFIFNLAIVITPLMVVIGGFMFVTGSGDAKKISDARALLLWTAIGFAVILLSRGLVQVLLSVLTI